MKEFLEKLEITYPRGRYAYEVVNLTRKIFIFRLDGQLVAEYNGIKVN